MPPDRALSLRCLRWWPPLACLALLGACSLLGGNSTADTSRVAARAPASNGIDRDAAAAVVLMNSIQTLQRLAQGTPAEQAEILATARQGYERSPGGGAQLRYALALATPGHAGYDSEQARRLLRDLAASPEALLPAERALMLVELAQLDRAASLQSENERLQGELTRADSNRQTALAKRLQAEIDDNARLRKQLEDAQAKLDAVANIERNLSERKNTNQGKKP
ncbi:MAG TPA: hypothetical protein VMI92_08115 [Steroidobacteraceae bacterium]|nr:hypothetical protein [Steroidobacteraceae bacterium]